MRLAVQAASASLTAQKDITQATGRSNSGQILGATARTGGELPQFALSGGPAFLEDDSAEASGSPYPKGRVWDWGKRYNNSSANKFGRPLTESRPSGTPQKYSEQHLSSFTGYFHNVTSKPFSYHHFQPLNTRLASLKSTYGWRI